MTRSSLRRQIILSRDTALGLLLVLALAAVCVGLGFWQYGRYETKHDQAAVVHSNYEAEPVALEDVLPTPTSPLAATDEWKQVTLHGSYCATKECVLYVRNRVDEGEVGFWQLAPFTADDGTTLLVVRGWVPSGDASEPVDPAPVPDGETTVTLRLRPAEPELDRTPPPGQTHSVNPPQSAGLMGLEADPLITGAYGELVQEEPAADRPRALPAPDTSLGPHLSYAFQWWIFALFFPGALVFRVRRQIQDLADEQADTAAQAAADTESTGATGSADTPRKPRATADHRPRRTVHARRRGQDEEEEDALIDDRTP